MANESRAPAAVGRVAIEGGVGGGIGYVLAQFLVGFVPAGMMEAVQLERLEILLLAAFTAATPAVMTWLRNAGKGGALTGATPLRSEIGVSSIVLTALTGALLLPGVTGCTSTMEQIQSLTPAGRYDIAKDAAVDVMVQLSKQAQLTVMDRDVGAITEDEARATYRGLRTAQRVLERAILAADVLRNEDPSAALLDLEKAVETARLELRRKLR